MFLLPFSVFGQKELKIHSNKIERFFKEVERIELVEIKQSCDTNYWSSDQGNPNTITDTFFTAEFKSLLIKDSIDLSRIQKRVSLNGNEIDSLKSIFTYRNDEIFGGRSMCYSPRNGIFFYDKNGKLLAYYEFCFECNNFVRYHIPWNDYLSLQQRNRIMDFFKEHGIRTHYRDC